MDILSDLYIARADVFLAGAILTLLVIGAFLKNRAMHIIAIPAITILAVSLMMTLQQDNAGEAALLFGDMIIYDRFGVFMKVLVTIGAIAAIFMGVRDLGHHVIGRFEYVILIMIATLGMNVMISANNMLSFYVGLELQSLSLYILAAFNRNSLVSSEAGLKYFILGALSSGILLFGISIIYGYTGTTSFPLIADVILMDQSAPISMPLVVGLVFIIVGLAFKISAVPFHMWTPDVYQGSPSCVTGFFAMAPKIAALAVFIRILMTAFADMQTEWIQVVYALSLASMLLGAFAGLVQQNLYRLLAYSSIGHMGYVLLGLIAGDFEGLVATLTYLAIYVMMTAATFAMILSVRNKDNIAATRLSDFAGLSKKSILVSYGLSMMLFSMAGIPPLAGFFGKLLVLKAVIASGYYVLAVVGVMTSVVAAYYYLKLIKIMFFDQPSENQDYSVLPSRLLRWVAVPTSVFVVTYIIYPDWLIYEAGQAALSLQ